MDRYLFPKTAIKFTSADVVTPMDAVAAFVELIRVGTFYDPRYGKIEIKPEHLDSFIKNFNERVRGVDIAIDFAHESDKEAAGWIMQLVRGGDDNNTLLANVKWTAEGKVALMEKKFRYLSAEFSLNYQDNESLEEFGPTLLGAGLTNRPVVKGMRPAIELSEDKMPTVDELDKENKALKEQISKYTDLEGENKMLKEKLSKLEKNPEDMNMDKKQFDEQLAAKDKELDDLRAKLSEKETAEKKLSEDKALEGKKAEFDALVKDEKAIEAQREAYMAGDTKKFMELAKPVKTTRLSEEGGKVKEEEDNKELSASEKITKLAEKVAADRKIEMGEAIGVVINDPANRKLADEHYKSF